MRTRTTRPRSATAFTLVELLVVMAIVAVLAAILFAVFARVRERGRNATCQNNLKQLALAMQMYVQNNDGAYPPALWAGAISPLVNNHDVFFCPTHDHKDTDGWTYYVYDFGRLVYFDMSMPATERARGRRETQVPDLSKIWLNADEDSFGGSGRTVSMCDREMVWYTLHSGGANYSFADGHIKWLTPEAMSQIECSAGPLPDSHH